MQTFNILFTSAGRRVSLIRSFKKSLIDLNLQGQIITADNKKNAPAALVADAHELVPLVNDENYINCLYEICEKHRIKLLIPLIDHELYLLACHQNEFKARGVTVLVSSVETNEICVNKIKTNSFFSQIGVKTPQIFDFEKRILESSLRYPLILKPIAGSSSVGVTVINNLKELEFFYDYIPNALIQEYITGQEYTLDVLVDFEGHVKSVVPRLRIETRAGEISKGMTVKNPALIMAGKKVVESLPGKIGCITVQCFLTPDDEIQFIEINPRFGGGFPLSLHAGANFPRWILEMILGRVPEIKIDDWQEEVVLLRYDESIFVDKTMVT